MELCVLWRLLVVPTHAWSVQSLMQKWERCDGFYSVWAGNFMSKYRLGSFCTNQFQMELSFCLFSLFLKRNNKTSIFANEMIKIQIPTARMCHGKSRHIAYHTLRSWHVHAPARQVACVHSCRGLEVWQATCRNLGGGKSGAMVWDRGTWLLW